MIALHGFDYDSGVFASWEALLGEHYTICAPDLPFHGNAEWDEHKFSDEDMVQLIQAIAKKWQCSSITLVGHSLGARILVCVAKDLTDLVERFIFLAPAGIGAFDRVVPLWGQRLLEWALQRPIWLRFGVNIGHRIGLVSNFHRRYAEVQLYPPKQRNRLFRTYNSLLHFSTSRADRLSYWKDNKITTLVILAEQDRFVPNPKIQEYFMGIPHVRLEMISGNHNLVNTATAQFIRVAIQKQ